MKLLSPFAGSMQCSLKSTFVFLVGSEGKDRSYASWAAPVVSSLGGVQAPCFASGSTLFSCLSYLL